MTTPRENNAATVLRAAASHLVAGARDRNQQTIIIGEIVGVLCAMGEHYGMTEENLRVVIHESWKAVPRKSYP